MIQKYDFAKLQKKLHNAKIYDLCKNLRFVPKIYDLSQKIYDLSNSFYDLSYLLKAMKVTLQIIFIKKQKK